MLVVVRHVTNSVCWLLYVIWQIVYAYSGQVQPYLKTIHECRSIEQWRTISIGKVSLVGKGRQINVRKHRRGKLSPFLVGGGLQWLYLHFFFLKKWCWTISKQFTHYNLWSVRLALLYLDTPSTIGKTSPFRQLCRLNIPVTVCIAWLSVWLVEEFIVNRRPLTNA